MPRTAFFTGAGTSKAIGYPLTREFTSRIRNELRAANETLFDGYVSGKIAKTRCRELRENLLRLMPGFEAAADDKLPLITDVFSLVEHAIAAGDALPIGDETRLRNCRDLLRMAITAILLDDFNTAFDRSEEDQWQKRTLERLVEWYSGRGTDIALVTTNYDIGLEYELYGGKPLSEIQDTIDLGFDWRAVGGGRVRVRPPDPSLRIYKLHGSLDTLRCRMCGHVYFNPAGTIAHQAFREEIDDDNRCECNRDLRLELNIVSPSLVRDIRDANLLSVWRSALEYMRRAQHWIIAGYSLPPEDLAIRSLLVRAYATARTRPEVTVVQHGEDARPQYELLFPGCTYEPGGVDAFLKSA
jgi:hypothetical protein